MAYETGYTANEFELQEKLNAFILSIGGWRKISQPSDFESVYFSNGLDGYKDIYIKTRAGLTEYPTSYNAGNQRDFGDGYTGFLNFFVYQFYPENGDGYDGYGEAGKFGPLLYWVTGLPSAPGYIYSQRFSQQSVSNRKWDFVQYAYQLKDGVTYPSSFVPLYTADYRQICFDGKRFIYWLSEASSGMFKFDLGVERNNILDTFWSWDKQRKGQLLYYIDPKTRKEYIWDFSQETWNGATDGSLSGAQVAGHIRRWDVSAGLIECGFQGPEWRNLSTPPSYDYGARQECVVCDGRDRIYVTRGESYSHGYTKEWGMYHIPTDKWMPLSDMPQPPHSMIWLDKRTSGFQYHRLYIYTYLSSTGATGIYYIDIDENNGMPVGSWVQATVQPVTHSIGSQLFHNSCNRFYLYNGSGNRGLYYSDIKDGSLAFSLIDPNYMPASTSQYTDIYYIDGYASRVRTSIADSTQYWFIGSKDHVVVMTNADGIYTWCYMGAIDPLAPNTPHALSVSDVYPGSSVEIPINLLKGEFFVGQQMFICNTVEGGGGWEQGDVENIPRKFMPIEKFTITNVVPGVSITAAQIKNTYRGGSRIAYDPQPVGITLEGLDKIQMLNCINTVNTSGGFDMAENIARLDTVKETIVNTSGNDARRGVVALWPVIAVNMDNEAAFSGSEARGVLRGIFAASGTAGVVSGDTIKVGGNTYLALGVQTGKSFIYVFGPIE